jgi:trk system potassium uptake protein TrkA
MKIIICGAGQVGGQIARHLARNESANQITIVDSDPALVRRITDAHDVNGVAGFASHPDVLQFRKQGQPIVTLRVVNKE